jgi:hypothetical protein
VILIATDKTRLYKAAKEPKQIHVKFWRVEKEQEGGESSNHPRQVTTDVLLATSHGWV